MIASLLDNPGKGYNGALKLGFHYLFSFFRRPSPSSGLPIRRPAVTPVAEVQVPPEIIAYQSGAPIAAAATATP